MAGHSCLNLRHSLWHSLMQNGNSKSMLTVIVMRKQQHVKKRLKMKAVAQGILLWARLGAAAYVTAMDMLHNIIVAGL